MLAVYIGHGIVTLTGVGFTRREVKSVGVLGGVVSALGAGYVLPTARHNSIIAVFRVCTNSEFAATVVTPHSEFQDFRGEVLPNDSLLSVKTNALG